MSCEPAVEGQTKETPDPAGLGLPRPGLPPGVCLVSPPAYYPWLIPPGVAYLAGFLESHGVPVRVLDANVEAVEHLLQTAVSDTVDVRGALASLRNPPSVRSWRYYQNNMRLLSGLAEQISKLSSEGLRFERNTLRYYPAFELRSRAGLLAAAQARSQHLFFPYYRDVLVPRIRELTPSLIGISASDLHQLLPATVLAAALREFLGPECPPLVLGGNVFSRIYDILAIPDPVNEELFRIWGSVVVGEGERPLLQFAEAIRRGEPFDGVEGTLRPGRLPLRRHGPLSLDEVSAPRCDGFTPLIPEVPVPLNIYRGCYLSGVCQFCDINQGYDSVWAEVGSGTPKIRGRLRNLDRVVDDIRLCASRYRTRLFTFTDEWFRLEEMLGLIDRLLAEKIQIQWDAYARLEPRLADPAVARRLALGGARFLQFGLETASPHLLKIIRKGTSPVTAAQIFKALSGAGIWSHVFVIVGLPGETLHDTLLTVNFLRENADNLFTIKPTRFQLSRHSPFATNRSCKYIEVEEDRARELDISLNLPFQYASLHYCRRCRDDATLSPAGEICPRCSDRIVSRPSLSRRVVNAVYTAMELLAARHWAYPFTSLFPYHLRLLFSPEDARTIALENANGLDRNLGLDVSEIKQVFRTVARQLQWEAMHVKHIREAYERAHTELAFEWTSYEDFCLTAERWAHTLSRSAITHTRESPPSTQTIDPKRQPNLAGVRR